MSQLTIAQQQKLFDALKWIAMHDSASKLERTAETRYGLSGTEAVGMAYDDVLLHAKSAVKGMKRPSEPTA